MHVKKRNRKVCVHKHVYCLKIIIYMVMLQMILELRIGILMKIGIERIDPFIALLMFDLLWSQ